MTEIGRTQRTATLDRVVEGVAARPARALPWLLGMLGILSQIAWVLVPASARDATTICSVLLMSSAGIAHAVVERGARWATGFVAITAGIGLGVEMLGTATGLPFGDYGYTDRLGPDVLDVPLLIPLAWCMAAYPILLLSQRLARTRAAVTVVGAWTIMAWDVLLDPQMVGEGHWSFADPTPGLPGSPGIPLTNYAGWFLTGLVIFWALDHLPRSRADDRLPTVLLLWIYGSNVMAAAVFFGRPAVAAWGAILMGVTVLPWARAAIPELRAQHRPHAGTEPGTPRPPSHPGRA